MSKHFIGTEFTRRHFIVAGAAAAGGLIVGWAPAAESQTVGVAPHSLGAFIRIDRQNRIAIVCPMIEMGQGTYTSLPMLLAEELDVDFDGITVEHAPANDALYGNPIILNEQITGGSTSIRAFYMPLRKAGAAARMMLIEAAAEQWQTRAADLTTDRGYVIDRSRDRRLPYGGLADRAARRPVPADVILKDRQSFKIIGTPRKRLDVSAKVNGSAIYGMDVKVPGMKIAAVAASPAFGGTLVRFDDAAARRIPGVTQVVKLGDALAVIGYDYWAASQGLAAATPVFDDGPHGRLSTRNIVDALDVATQRPGAVAKHQGDAAAALSSGIRTIEAIYQAPFLAHATMEPMNCTVSVTARGCDIWTGTQVPVRAQKAAARELGLNADQVRVHNQYLGGGFGRRLEFDYVVQAVRIARQLNYPVKVIWSREEDIQHDMYRPYYFDRIAAGLDDEGMPVAWSHRIAGSSILARWLPAWFKDGVDFDAVDGAAELPYDIANQQVEFARVEPAAIPTAFWRGVGPTHNIYVVESFIDELAAAAKKDPVEYRRSLLKKNPRALHVLERAVALSGWGSPLGGRRGRGISLQQTFGSFMCQVAEVTVSAGGEVRVDRMIVVVDAGVAVNPDTIKAQMQSGVIYGISALLWGEITVENGRVQQSNFDNYRVLRMEETPDFVIEIVDSNEDPGGIGEPGTSCAAPAILNAIYAATGVRLRKTPIGTKLLAI